MKFQKAIAATEVLFFFDSISATRILMTGRAVSNNTVSSSHSITSPPSTTTPVLNFCTKGPFGDVVDCTNLAMQVGFDPEESNPYNTDLHPENIVPPNPSIASYCGSLWSSSAAAFFATDPITAYTQSGDRGINETLFVDTFTWVPTATQCCLNCTIMGGAIQVMVWPTPAPSPVVSTLVDPAANFTFTSPSVYVIFESIGATNLCGSLGQTYINKTLAFDPGELSTQRNYFAATAGVSDVDLNQDYCTHATPNDAWSTFDYLNAEAGQCTDITTSWWSYYGSDDTTLYSDEAAYTSARPHVSCGLGCVGVPINDFTCVFNPCSPFVSVPTQVYGLDPDYSTCIDGIKAFFDPPYTLTAGNGLVAFSPTPTPSKAAPAGSPQSFQAAPTAKPKPRPSSTQGNPVPVKSPSRIPPPADPDSTKIQPTGDPKTSNQVPGDPETTVKLPPPSKISSPGGEAVTIGGTKSSLGPSTPLVVDGSTVASATTSGANPLVIGSQTLSPGSSAVTVDGTTYSLATSGNALVVDGTTQYTIASQTLIAGGPAITVGGTVVSLQSGGQSVVVGSSTEAISTFLASATSSGLGGVIVSIGGFSSSSGQASSTGFNGTIFTGAAARSWREVRWDVSWVVWLGVWNWLM